MASAGLVLLGLMANETRLKGVDPVNEWTWALYAYVSDCTQ